jgi:hypothetical protein
MKKTLIAALIGVAFVGAACAPPPTGGGGAPCWSDGVNDLLLSGPIDTADNVEVHDTSTGSCDGNVLTSLTVVDDGTFPGAEGKCWSLAGAPGSYLYLTDAGFSTAPATYAYCVV